MSDNKFSVSYYRRDLATSYNPPFTTSVQRYSAMRGNYEAALLEVTGSAEAIKEALNMVRWGVEVKDSQGRLVWAGYIHSVQIESGGVAVGKTLNGMANKIKVAYTNENNEAAYTGWQEDEVSAGEYGTKEGMVTLTRATQTSAESKRGKALTTLKEPLEVVSFGGGPPEARALLVCKGFYSTLDWIFYENTRGKVVASSEGEGALYAIGLSALTTSEATFVPSGAGGVVIIGEAQSETFAGYTDGLKVTVSGSSLNNGTYTITGVSSDNKRLYTAEPLTDEGPIGPVTFVPPTSQAAQSFSLPQGHDWKAHRARLRVAALGGPAGGLYLDIAADSGGLPGGVLATSDLVNASDVTENRPDWLEFKFDNGPELDEQTAYWLILRRQSGTENSEAGFVVEAVEENFYNDGTGATYGTSWGAIAGGHDFPFEVWGLWPLYRQIDQIEADCGQFLSGVIHEYKALEESSPLRDGSYSGLTELEELLSVGSSNGRPLMAIVDAGRRLFIKEEEDKAVPAYRLKMSGEIEKQSGGKVPPWAPVSGAWATLVDFPTRGLKAVFIEGAEYEATNGYRRLILRDPTRGQIL